MTQVHPLPLTENICEKRNIDLIGIGSLAAIDKALNRMSTANGFKVH
jgi:hypothetical protein